MIRAKNVTVGLGHNTFSLFPLLSKKVLNQIITVGSLLMDTLVPAFLYFLYLTLYKMNI